jgi:BirA family transcriptional regulator, biotin operon repressor / biotin---[acetyl-CoA-carboxylase] ligase
MTAPREEWQLDTRRLGRRVLIFDRLDSTNTLAARLAAEGATEGIAILADEQTAGRGQHGRTWQAGPGDGVLLSLLLFPPPALRRPAVLTAWAAVGVCGVVREVTGVPARIKWPNDVLVRGRKVCGILIEQGGGASGLATVAGIGLNVRQSAEAFAAADLPEAASLAQLAPAPPDTAEVARLLIRRLDEEYDRLCLGDLSALEESWRSHLDLLGRQVVAECQDGTHVAGRLRALSFEGVELDRPGAPPLVLRPERVQHLLHP